MSEPQVAVPPGEPTIVSERLEQSLDDRLLFSQAQGVLVGLTECSRRRAAQALQSTAVALALDVTDIAKLFLSCLTTADDELAEAVVLRVAMAALTSESGDVEIAAGHHLPGRERVPLTGRAALIRSLKVVPHEVGEPRGVTLAGELDLATAPLLAAETADAGTSWGPRQPKAGGCAFTLDLARLTFVDVSGMRALERVQRQVDACGEALRVVLPQAPGPRRLLSFAVEGGWLSAAFSQDELSVHRVQSPAVDAPSHR
jgi:ABC-type transporter Mla MlaB component